MSSFAESYVGRVRALVGAMPTIFVSSRVVIERADGAILLEHRSDFGVWGLPGGAVEDDESIEESVYREVFEETGLTIAHPVPFGFASDPKVERVVYPGGDVTLPHAMLFLVKEFSGELRIQAGENTALCWFQPDAFPEVKASTARGIEALRRWRETGVFQLS